MPSGKRASLAEVSFSETDARGFGGGNAPLRALSQIISIKAPASIRPGTIPPANIAAIEVFCTKAYIIIRPEGGMIGAKIPADAITAAEIPLGYFKSFIAGISIEPRAEASATAEPEPPESITDASTQTCAKPPRKCPIKDSAKRTILTVTPPADISSPAKTKKGRAIRAKESTPFHSL